MARPMTKLPAQHSGGMIRISHAGTRPSLSDCGSDGFGAIGSRLEQPGQRAEFLDRKLLGAPRRIDADRGRIEAERLEAAAQHLAPLAEGSGGHPLQSARTRPAPAAPAAAVRVTTAEATFGGGVKAR